MREIKEGDIYNWSYKNEDEYYQKHSGSGTAYWCMDRQAVAIERNGRIVLVDTYWNGPDPELIRISDSTHFVNPDKVDLEFVCNAGNVIALHSWEQEDYDVIYNLSWQKGSYKVLATDKEAYDKGPSKAAVLKNLQNQLRKANEDLRSAQWSVERIEKEIEELYK